MNADAAHQPQTPATDFLFDSIVDGIFTVDENFRITSFNRAAEEITGHSREQVLGRRCTNVFQASICGDRCGLKRAFQNDCPVLMKAVTIQNAKGQRIPVSLSAGALHDENGRTIGAVETFRDLSRIETVHASRPAEAVPRIVGQSPAMNRVFELIPCVAETPSTVLIEGESGTGKELVARAIHELSSRRDRRLVTVNCAAMPDTLLESELFGHKPGAFTDARKEKLGRFELADGGTIFLDEIGDVSPAMQTRLLRVLQERVIEPLGSTRPVKVDVRVLAATNRNLTELVANGTFRKDLYYRLNVIRISIPPLRDRLDDVPLLVDTFLERLNVHRSREIEGVTPEVIDVLLKHDFPGNVRELQNILEHAAVLCPRGVIRCCHLPEEFQGLCSEPASPETEPTDPVESLQRSLITSSLERHHGNRRAAARDLGIHPTTLWRRARRLGISLPEIDGRNRAWA